VETYLQTVGIKYKIDPYLVRGLDYYTKTAFEIMVEGIGAQSSIGGGGRYDRLVEECGGPAIPGIGFAMGLERILLTMEQQGLLAALPASQEVFIATVAPEQDLAAFKLVQELRRQGVGAEKDYLARSLKAQLKFADKLGCNYVVILGEEELAKGKAMLKSMRTGQQTEVNLAEIGAYVKQKV
jgi:histidyl-tRNA synthetase